MRAWTRRWHGSASWPTRRSTSTPSSSGEVHDRLREVLGELGSATPGPHGHPGLARHPMTGRTARRSPRTRLDAELVRRGLARSREQAAELIAAGRVMVSGDAAVKAATQVTRDAPITVTGDDTGPRLRLPRRPQAGRRARRLPRPGRGRASRPGRRRLHRRLYRRTAARGRRPRDRGRRRLRPAGLVAADRPAGDGAGPGQRAFAAAGAGRRAGRPPAGSGGRGPVVHLAGARAARAGRRCGRGRGFRPAGQASVRSGQGPGWRGRGRARCWIAGRSGQRPSAGPPPAWAWACAG